MTVEDDASALTPLDERYPCLIEDMSHGGFLLVCSERFSLGQVLNFSCELLPEKMLACKLKVVHVGDSIIGTKIVEIDDKSIELCQVFLRNQFAMQRLKDSIEAVKSASTDQEESDS